MTMGANLPIAILPGIVITELRRVFELLLRNGRAESAKRLVVSQGAPWDGIVAVAETQEAPKAHRLLNSIMKRMFLNALPHHCGMQGHASPAQ
jgi:hypothetical protein